MTRRPQNEELKDTRLNRDVVEDRAFREACEAANIEPTTRQAGKWKRKTGLAYAAARFAQINEGRYKPGSPELYNALKFLGLRKEK